MNEITLLQDPGLTIAMPMATARLLDIDCDSDDHARLISTPFHNITDLGDAGKISTLMMLITGGSLVNFAPLMASAEGWTERLHEEIRMAHTIFSVVRLSAGRYQVERITGEETPALGENIFMQATMTENLLRSPEERVTQFGMVGRRQRMSYSQAYVPLVIATRITREGYESQHGLPFRPYYRRMAAIVVEAIKSTLQDDRTELVMEGKSGD